MKEWQRRSGEFLAMVMPIPSNRGREREGGEVGLVVMQDLAWQVTVCVLREGKGTNGRDDAWPVDHGPLRNRGPLVRKIQNRNLTLSLEGVEGSGRNKWPGARLEIVWGYSRL